MRPALQRRMAKEVKRGSLIVFEGLDRVGKSTQAKLLVDYLNRHKITARSMRFPDRTTAIGKLIDQHLSGKFNADDHAIHLLFSANRWEKNSEMKAALQAGITLVVDRYYHSGAAYSSVKGLDMNWCLGPEAGLLEPDIVIYMNLPLAGAAKRSGFGKERYETKEMQSGVKSAFQALMKKRSSWVVVDGSPSIEEVGEEVIEIALNTIKFCHDQPIKITE
jgi:dTMP kinase